MLPGRQLVHGLEQRDRGRRQEHDVRPRPSQARLSGATAIERVPRVTEAAAHDPHRVERLAPPHRRDGAVSP